ncbi:hypothetical protein ANCDUO_00400 [Ancylostoma duodenale]|uniref:Uncharacterized protein n=1 Tax=Ancylostoma duodenale TaxID=51022 RepID=A0A0C2HC73_9BILA|nr:hypothetical protein ANCDUO_00400 [Ancylostoma duodenale]
MGRLKEVKWRINRKSEITKELHTRSMRSEYCRVSGTVHAEEAPLSSLPMYDVFLGGSCGTTVGTNKYSEKRVWRRQLVIPFLKKKAISYYDPQRSVWSENMIYEESIAKEVLNHFT